MLYKQKFQKENCIFRTYDQWRCWKYCNLLLFFYCYLLLFF